MTARLPLILFAALAFSGCTTIALEPLPDGMTDQPPADWTERSRNLGRFDHWQLSGKLAVKQPSDSGTAVINRWLQNGEQYDLSLSSSFLGMGTTRLQGVPGFIELTLANGDVYQSSDPETLVNDEHSQLAIIRQDGWEIRYDRWHGFIEDLPSLPARITALKEDKRVRVVIADWRRED